MLTFVFEFGPSFNGFVGGHGSSNNDQFVAFGGFNEFG